MSQVIKDLNWRYATKKFDADKKVSDEDFTTLLEGLKLTATSYGLQLMKFVQVEDKQIRLKLQAAAWGQGQVVDASHLLVFTAQTDVTVDDIDSYLKNISETRGAPLEALSGYGDFMKKAVVQSMPQETKQAWMAKQTYIALGNLLNLAANMKIDVTPIEGFEPSQFDEILGLKSQGLASTVVAAIGYRSQDDATAGALKVRKTLEELVIKI